MSIAASSSGAKRTGIVCHEIGEQLHLVWPVWLTLICRKSVDIMPIIFVGRLGASYLSAAGLATVTANVTGYSMLIGFRFNFFLSLP